MSRFLFVLSVFLFLMLFGGNETLPFIVPFVFAHCDTMDGPVIKDAKKALETGNIDQVLIWVQAKDGPAIKKAFEKALSVRKFGPDAKEMADMYFFETLVRVHREGEGVSYTGIKPAGTEIEPGIEAADKAVDAGNIDGLVKEISSGISTDIRERFGLVMERKKHMAESVEAGREYVEAYVSFIHYIERLHMAMTESAHHGAGHKEEMGH